MLRVSTCLLKNLDDNDDNDDDDNDDDDNDYRALLYEKLGSIIHFFLCFAVNSE